MGPRRPSRIYREAHTGGKQDLRSHGRGARAMGDRAIRRARRRREGTGLQAAREAQALPRKGEGTMKHFRWEVEARVATITLNRPERKNPLTFESYAELRDLFRGLASASDVRSFVMRGPGGNFCSVGH